MSLAPNAISATKRTILATILAVANETRGTDSWGCALIDERGTHVCRGLGSLSLNSFEISEHNVFFAHTRHATNGSVSLDNAHPFKVGKILGAHNGMIYNHRELNKKYGRKFEVDSMHLFAHLDENKPFNELYGYGAIQWMQEGHRDSIYLSRLRDGELAVYGIGSPTNSKGVVWSSSYQHLRRALFSAGINDYFKYNIKTGSVYRVHNGKLLRNMNMKLNLGKYVEPDNELGNFAGTCYFCNKKVVGKPDANFHDKCLEECQMSNPKREVNRRSRIRSSKTLSKCVACHTLGSILNGICRMCEINQATLNFHHHLVGRALSA